jgi:nucleotide-binding universal stress UspA family protein
MKGCILLAFDGSAQSMKALDEAVRLAKGLKTKLLLLHVYWEEGVDVNINPKMIATSEVDIEARKMFGKLEKSLKEVGVEYELRSVLSHDAPSAITENAEKDDCEMIVIGNRGVGMLRGFLLGSVAEKVASTSTRSVLIVK